MQGLCYLLHSGMMSTGVLRGQRCPIALELELETDVSCSMWTGREPNSDPLEEQVVFLTSKPPLALVYTASVHQTQETNTPLNLVIERPHGKHCGLHWKTVFVYPLPCPKGNTLEF